MDIQNTLISAKVVIESMIALLENEDVDISSIKFKVGNKSDGYESEDMSFESLIELTLNWLEEAKKIPNVATVGSELQSWLAVHSYAANRFGVPVVDANAIAEVIEELTGANA